MVHLFFIVFVTIIYYSGHRTSPERPGTKRRPLDVQNEIKVVQKGRWFLDVLSNSFGPFF